MISKEEVKHIAKLARLELSDKEVGKFQKDLSAILDYFEMLKEIDVSKVEPTFHPYEQGLGVMRKDEVRPEPAEQVNRLIELAPSREKRHIKVKSIF